MADVGVRALVVVGVLAAAGVLAACAGNRTPPPPTTSTVVTGTSTVVSTRTVAPPQSAGPATSVAPLPRSGKAPAGEVARTCPYIAGGLDSEPTSKPNVADIEGDRVGAVTVLTGFSPVGCRFYFAYSYGEFAHEAIADIQPHTYPTAAAARNAMIRTATAGRNAQTEQGFVRGLVGIRYQTTFFGPDGATDWAFVFAKGRHMVVVHTQQTNASLNAQLLAAAIASKF